MMMIPGFVSSSLPRLSTTLTDEDDVANLMGAQGETERKETLLFHSCPRAWHGMRTGLAG